MVLVSIRRRRRKRRRRVGELNSTKDAFRNLASCQGTRPVNHGETERCNDTTEHFSTNSLVPTYSGLKVDTWKMESTLRLTHR